MTAGTNTSQTYNFAPALADVIITAYGRCGIRRTAITPEHLHDAVAESNLLQSEWANNQVNLWTVDLQTIPLVPGQAVYDVDPSTVMVLGTWISTGAPPDRDRIIISVDRDTYAAFPDKVTPGEPTQYMYDAKILPTITLWQPPDAAEARWLKFYRARQMQDAVLPDGLEAEVPYRFLDAYVGGLSWRLAVHYAADKVAGLKGLAKEAFDTAKNRDVEKSALRIVPAMSIYTNAVY